MLDDLLLARTATILHDIGKPECWANKKPFSHHIYYTEKLVKEIYGDEVAAIAARHHASPYYPEEYRPATDLERVIAMADTIASGADRPEEAEHKGPLPTPPIYITHILSGGDISLYETSEKELAYFRVQLSHQLKDDKGFDKLYSTLEDSIITRVPADTRPPVNDASLWDHLKFSAAISNCLIRSGGYRGENLEKYTFSILTGDADQIQAYIQKSARIPDLRARSRMVEKATESASETIANMIGRECVLFTGGGGFLALSPPNLSQQAVTEAKKAFENQTDQEMTLTVAKIDATAEQVKKDFGKVWERANIALRRAKNMRPTILGDTIEGVVCDVCGEKEGVYPGRWMSTVPPRQEMLCPGCHEKRSSTPGIDLGSITDDKGYLAILRADADNLGEVLSGEALTRYSKKMTPSRLATFSRTIKQVFKDDIADAVKRAHGENIYVGGDDLLSILPGREAFTLLQELPNLYQKRSPNSTISAALVLFKEKMPIYVTLNASRILLEKAKSNPGKASVAFTIITGVGATDPEIEKREPYTWRQFKEMFQTSMRLKETLSASQLRAVYSLIRDKNKGRDFAEVYIKNQMGRGEIAWDKGHWLIEETEKRWFTDSFLLYSLYEK